MEKSVYVVGADVLMDHPDIVQLTTERSANLTPNLSDAHLAIPLAAIREISKHVGVGDNKSQTRRYLLKRLRGLTESTVVKPMLSVYKLQASMKVPDSDQEISLVPMRQEIMQRSLFDLSEHDIGDQMIAATILTGIGINRLNMDESIDKIRLEKELFTNVTLLTNDDALAIRAHSYGLKTSRYEECKNLSVLEE